MASPIIFLDTEGNNNNNNNNTNHDMYGKYYVVDAMVMTQQMT